HGVRTLAHADGGAVMFVDAGADNSKMLRLIEESLDRLGVCNRLNLLLIDEQRWDELIPPVTELLTRLGITPSLPPHPHDLGQEGALDTGHEAPVTIAPANGAAGPAATTNDETSGRPAASDTDV